MDKFTSHTGTILPLRRSNVDTDQIIPAVYLKRVTRTGFEDGLFGAWRNDPDFILNKPEYDGASVLVLSLIHISEPTRRTPISYAVFCLKKKNIQQHKLMIT